MTSVIQIQNSDEILNKNANITNMNLSSIDHTKQIVSWTDLFESPPINNNPIDVNISNKNQDLHNKSNSKASNSLRKNKFKSNKYTDKNINKDGNSKFSNDQDLKSNDYVSKNQKKSNNEYSNHKDKSFQEKKLKNLKNSSEEVEFISKYPSQMKGYHKSAKSFPQENEEKQNNETWETIPKKKFENTKNKKKKQKNSKKDNIEIIKVTADDLQKLKEKSSFQLNSNLSSKKEISKKPESESNNSHHDIINEVSSQYLETKQENNISETQSEISIKKKVDISEFNEQESKKSTGKKRKKQIQEFTEVLKNNITVSIPSNDILEHHYSSIIKKPVGLVNLTNTCFMSCVIQTLIHLPHFQKLMTLLYSQNLSKSQYPFFHSFWNLMEEMKKAQSVASPNELGTLLSNSQNLMQIGVDQNDAHEFLLLVFDLLHKELLPINSNNDVLDIKLEDNGWEEVGKFNKKNKVQTMGFLPSSISLLFSGMMRCLVKRKNEQGSLTLQPFYSLHLPIEDIKTVKEALTLALSKEIVNDETRQEITLDSLPPVLVLHLNRFTFDPETQKSKKISRFIKFEENLYIDESILSKAKSPLQSKERNYTLHSIIQHHGNDINSGHYTSLVRFGKDVWYNFNDENVSKYTTKESLGEQAYILIYIRGDV